MSARNRTIIAGSIAAAFVGGLLIGHGVPAAAQGNSRIFELRTYTTNEGKLGGLVNRMGGPEKDLFRKHGMEPMAFFVAAEAPKSENTFVYILAHKSREAARASWAAFGADPEWRKVAQESEANGRFLVQGGVQSVFLNATDFSPLK